MRGQLGPVARQQTFQPMDELQVALLVQIHDGQGRTQLAAVGLLLA